MERVTSRTGWSPEVEDSATAEPPPTEDADRSTVEILRLLIAEGRDYATTEMERQKLRARIIGTAARDAAILILVALFLLAGMLVALLVGGILALTPHVGPVVATLLVLVLSCGVILLLALIARARLRAAMRCLGGEEETP